MHTKKAKEGFDLALLWAGRCSVIPGQQGSFICNLEKQKPSLWMSPPSTFFLQLNMLSMTQSVKE